MTPYLGVPFNLWVYQAKSFLSNQFTTLVNILGCNLIPISVEAHWSPIAERHNESLRRISQKLMLENRAAPLALILDYSNLSMSHTVGSEGFTRAILEFGAQLLLPIRNCTMLPQTAVNRMDLMTTSRREYEGVVAALRVLRALHAATPNDTFRELTPGDEVLTTEMGKDGMVHTLCCIMMVDYQ